MLELSDAINEVTGLIHTRPSVYTMKFSNSTPKYSDIIPKSAKTIVVDNFVNIDGLQVEDITSFKESGLVILSKDIYVYYEKKSETGILNSLSMLYHRDKAVDAQQYLLMMSEKVK